MAELNLRSSAVKAIKRIHARVSEATIETWDVFQLEQELRSLESHFGRFVENHNHLVAAASGEEIGPHDGLWETVERLYGEACSRINRLVASSRGAPIATSSGGAPNCPTSNLDGFSLDLKLDPLAIPTFDGDMCNWLAFKDAFETLVHRASYPEAFKLGKLRQAVSASKVPLVGGIYSGGYEEVWKALKERFDNRSSLRKYMARFLNLKAATEETSRALLAIVDTVHESLRALRVMEIPVNQWDALAVPIVVSKLPHATKRDWCMKCNSNEIPKLDDLMKYLERRAHSICPDPSAAQSVRRSVKSYAVAIDAGQCVHCGGAHRITRCPTLTTMSTQQRFDAVRNLKLCYNCLRSGHSSRQCPSGGCRSCGRKHNTILCRDKPSSMTVPASAPESPTPKEETGQVSTNPVS